MKMNNSIETLNAGDRIIIEGINWDTDGDDPADLELPENTEITLPDHWDEDSEVADILSDYYGFCVNSIDEIRKA